MPVLEGGEAASTDGGQLEDERHNATQSEAFACSFSGSDCWESMMVVADRIAGEY